MTNAEKVKVMMLRYGQTVPVRPIIPASDVIDLRVKLLFEEVAEAVEAIHSGDIKEIAKELCDILVVTYGALLAYGINPDLAFDLVNHSNATKFGADGKPVVREDGKVMKGENYQKPDMYLIYEAVNT